MVTALHDWPRRRWVAGAALAPVLTILFVAAGRGTSQWWQWPAAVLTGVVAVMVLVSYLPRPGAGRRLAVGCSPCAAAAAMTVPLALMARSAAPADPAMALIAGVLVAAGLRQRLTDTVVCAIEPRGQ